MNDAAHLLEVDAITVHYGLGRRRHQVLHDVSLAIPPRSTFGLVGESGSGKTTLGRAILGLAKVATGSIRFDSEDITHAGARRRRELARAIQPIFQDPYTSLNPSMRVADILTEPLQAQGTPRAEARRRVRELLDQVRMPADAESRYAREFSGGQRQRIAIARALALRPRLIVCDEPVSALDVTTQARVLDLLRQIQEDTDVSMLFISHDLQVVGQVSDQIAVMYQGRIVETGAAADVVHHPTHPYTQRLWAADLLPDPAAQAERRQRRRELAAARA